MTPQDTMRLALDALKQAKDSVSEWGSYASEYFRQKHDLQGDLDAIQSAITALREALSQQGESSSLWLLWTQTTKVIGQTSCQTAVSK